VTCPYEGDCYDIGMITSTKKKLTLQKKTIKNLTVASGVRAGIVIVLNPVHSVQSVQSVQSAAG
jgi:hypothetical protein